MPSIGDGTRSGSDVVGGTGNENGIPKRQRTSEGEEEKEKG